MQQFSESIGLLELLDSFFFFLKQQQFNVASDTSDILTCQVIFKTVGGGNENPDSTNPNGMPTTAASCFASDVVVTSTGGTCFDNEDRKRIYDDDDDDDDDDVKASCCIVCIGPLEERNT